MTPHILKWIKSHQEKLTGNVLEIGSFDVNGAVREVIPVSVGVDLRRGHGVDLVCSVSDLRQHFPVNSFDACVSTETLEHVEDWKGFVRVTWDLVREGGYLAITMASKHKGKHSYPNDFWRFELEQIRQIYPSLEWAGNIPDVDRPTSIGWIVKKSGELGDLDSIEPIPIK